MNLAGTNTKAKWDPEKWRDGSYRHGSIQLNILNWAIVKRIISFKGSVKKLMKSFLLTAKF